MPSTAGTGEYEQLVGDSAGGGLLNPRLSPRSRALAWTLLGLLLATAIGLAVGVAVLAPMAAGESDHDDGDDDGKSPAPPPPPPSPPVSIAAAMETKNLMKHLESFEAIAKQHQDSRAPQYGYNASVQYVKEQLAQFAPRWKVSTESFPLEVFAQVAEPTLRQNAPGPPAWLVRGKEFEALRGFAGAVTVTGLTKNVANLGCDPGDWSQIGAGDIALVKRGICSFSSKVEAGCKAGAAAVILWNDGTAEDRMGPVSTNVGESTCPSASVAYWIGRDWEQSAVPVNVTYSMHERGWTIETTNVFAETPEGDPNSVVVFGSHLDSVEAGPGINDDGSGSATNLELAIQLHNTVSEGTVLIKNKIRFAWWAAEELGLLGSRFYLHELNRTNPAELAKIAMNWNMDSCV
jgi:Peptidase family M28/PA domain